MKTKNFINEILLPLKLIIPQPIVEWIPGLASNKEIRVEKVLKYISINMNCLDIGCGDNTLIKRLRSRGASGVGIDIYPWDCADLVIEDSSRLPFDNNSFDCITFVASLNHIPNRLEVLMEARRILKRNGIVIITFLTPKISVFWHKIIYWDKDQNKRGMKKGEKYGFTHRELCSLLEDAGFRIVEKKKFSLGLNNLYICQILIPEF